MNNIILNTPSIEEQLFWDNTDGVIDNFAIHPLKAQAAGELFYTGISLHDLAGRDDNEDANYAIKLKVMGTQNLRLDLRTRRQDENNFIALKVDFITDTIKLVETIAGVESIIDQASHDFKFLGRTKYDLELWMLGRFLYGFVNGFNIVTGSRKSFRTEPGLSLSLPDFNSSDPPLIYTISANETEAFPDPMPVADEILLTFRQSIKQQIENPSTRTWDTYVKAVKFYEQRNVGMPDASWAELGYPIKKPSAEEWFGNLP